jgi:hypothetical protein
MLPACRTAGAAWAMPTFALTPRAGAACTDALQECPGLLHACVPRRAPRAHGCDATVGPWSPLDQKSSAPMALRVSGGSGRGRQRFLRAVPGDDEHMRWPYQQRVADEMGAPAGVLMGAALGWVKKGPDPRSPGPPARPWPSQPPWAAARLQALAPEGRRPCQDLVAACL